METYHIEVTPAEFMTILRRLDRYRSGPAALQQHGEEKVVVRVPEQARFVMEHYTRAFNAAAKELGASQGDGEFIVTLAVVRGVWKRGSG